MGTTNLPHPDFTAIRWTLEPGPAIDDAEPIELDDIDLDSISNPLAPSLVAVLKTNRRLQDRLRHAAELIKASIELLHIRHLEIERLQRQVHSLRDELRDQRYLQITRGAINLPRSLQTANTAHVQHSKVNVSTRRSV